jgi:hypothetical protein
MHELSRRSARNYAPTRDVSVSRRCSMRDLLLHGHYKLVALGVIGKKTREQPNCGSPMPTSDSAGLSTALDCPRHAMLAQRRRSWQRGRQLVCRRGDRMAASTLGSRASHTPSARIARSPRARRRCRHFIVLDADRYEKDRWRCAAPRVPGLARRRPCPRGRGRASGLPQLSCAPRGGSLPARAGCAERRRAEPVWLTHTERETQH